MLPIDLSAKHLVIGFGITGLSVVKALDYLGAQHIWATDSRENPPNSDEIKTIATEIFEGGFNHDWLDQCDYLWLSPGIPLATPELQDCLKRLPKDHVGGDIELFARLTQKDTIVGITGTNGKSTVTTLSADILSADREHVFVGGNLGEPALNLWLEAQHKNIQNPTYVLELSSFQLETTDNLNVDVGVILNLAPDHLDRYNGFDDYANAKFKLLDMAKRWVVNYEDQYLMDHIASRKTQKPMTGFALKQTVEAGWQMNWQEGLPVAISNQSISIPLNEISIGGLHNYANVMACCCIADDLHVSEQALKVTIKTYQALPHRCVLVKAINGVRYYNDSKATNLPSTIAAIEGFLEPKWLILGGVTKDQDFSELMTLLDSPSMLGVYLIGKDISAIAPHIPAGCESHYVETLEKALQAIHARAKSGEVVLFSPACASFDQFKSFNDRGEHFIRLVEALEN